MTEVYNPEKHPDATVQPGGRLRNGRIARKQQADRELVEMDPYDDQLRVVHERWNSIMQKVCVLHTLTIHECA